MAGLHHCGITGEDALRAADILLHDIDFDTKMRYRGRLTAADFRRVIESLPRNGVSYNPQQVEEFIRRWGYDRRDFPVIGRGELNEPIHKYIPYVTEV